MGVRTRRPLFEQTPHPPFLIWQVLLEDDGSVIPFKVQFDYGGGRWVADRIAVVGAHAGSALGVGSLVVRSGSEGSLCMDNINDVGRVKIDDHSSMPYNVECPTGRTWWFYKPGVAPAPAGAVFGRAAGGGAAVSGIGVGSLVVRSGSAGSLCMADSNDVGRVKIDDKSSMPYKVECPTGRTWWFHAEEVALAPAGAVYGKGGRAGGGGDELARMREEVARAERRLADAQRLADALREKRHAGQPGGSSRSDGIQWGTVFMTLLIGAAVLWCAGRR